MRVGMQRPPRPSTSIKLTSFGISGRPRLFVVIISEQHADATFQCVERLGPNALFTSGNQELDIAVRVPTVHGQSFLIRVDNPIVTGTVPVIDALLRAQPANSPSNQ